MYQSMKRQTVTRMNFIPQNVDNSSSSDSKDEDIQDKASSLEIQQIEKSQIDGDSQTHTEEQSP